MVSNEIEQAIDDALRASWNFALSHVDRNQGAGDRIAGAQDYCKQTRAALIALLARDDARIARLENVANEARQAANDFCLYFDDSQTSIWDRLNDALAALDADAPGGG